MENTPLTSPTKMQQRVSQLILVGLSALYNILIPGNVFFKDGVQDGRPNPLIVKTLKRTTQI